jgi:5-methyltetrahydrofolate--homocysteine methyltransferase
MAIQAGMTSAITNPLHAEVVAASMGADVMLGKDPDCSRWIKQFREPAPEGTTRGAGRRAGRRRRPAA